jgi:hypothetical protein
MPTEAPRPWAWACGCCGRRRLRTGGHAGEAGGVASGEEWSLFMDLAVLEAATDSFSDDNLLGRGGFGPVYKVTSVLSEQCSAGHLCFFLKQIYIYIYIYISPACSVSRADFAPLIPVTFVLIFARIARIIESGRIDNCFVTLSCVPWKHCFAILCLGRVAD